MRGTQDLSEQHFPDESSPAGRDAKVTLGSVTIQILTAEWGRNSHSHARRAGAAGCAAVL